MATLLAIAAGDLAVRTARAHARLRGDRAGRSVVVVETGAQGLKAQEERASKMQSSLREDLLGRVDPGIDGIDVYVQYGCKPTDTGGALLVLVELAGQLMKDAKVEVPVGASIIMNSGPENVTNVGELAMLRAAVWDYLDRGILSWVGMGLLPVGAEVDEEDVVEVPQRRFGNRLYGE